eukprot:6318493-Karenia_brevis.AAC.1
MQQWVPISKFLVLAAIIDNTRECVAGPSSIINSLAQFWSPVFDGSATKHDAMLAQAILNSLPCTPSWDWGKMQLPDRR